MKGQSKKNATLKKPPKTEPRHNGTPKKRGGTQQAKPFYVVGIGASAGGISAVSELVSQISPDINAAVLVVLHLSKTSLGDILVTPLQRHTSLPCKMAGDKEMIKAGHIYLAPPDVHLLVREDKLVLGRGPTENRFRPSIDVLFRSMAAHYGERAIGIVLTGFLSDGTSGMVAIKESGGYCIVQDPNEAEYPDMPLSVLETMEVDQCIPLKQMGKIILDTSKLSKMKSVLPPENVVMESRISEQSATGFEHVSKLGDKSLFACPDCGGGLWNVKNAGVNHYRCHIGHSYSEKDLILKQGEAVENTLWVPVIMVSANPNIALLSEQAGADAYIEKPFEVKDLLSTIEHYI